MGRDNNVGMWSRGPSGNDDGVSDSGPDYMDDMSGGGALVVLSSSFTMLCFLLSYRVILLTVLL